MILSTDIGSFCFFFILTKQIKSLEDKIDVIVLRQSRGETNSEKLITGCTKSTSISALLRKAGLLSLAVLADNHHARLHERALRDRQDTPIAQAADGQRKLLDEVTQGDKEELKLKFSVRATRVPDERRAGADTAAIETAALGPPPPPWSHVSGIHMWTTNT